MAASEERIARLKSRLARYEAAEEAILGNQSYEVDGRKLTRADLKVVTDMIERLGKQLDTATGAPRGRMRRGVLGSTGGRCW